MPVSLVIVAPENKSDPAPFSEFWALYPRKVAKAYAGKIFAKLTLLDRYAAIKALPQYIEHWRINAESIQFVPHASTWLAQRRFEDDLSAGLPEFVACHWPRCDKAGTHKHGSGDYCETHRQILIRGGTPPR